MIFNSFSFLFVFLPFCLVVFFLIASFSRVASQAFLGGMSCLFVGWYGFPFLPLLAGSILFNYTIGRLIIRWRDEGNTGKRLLFFGIGANLLALFYYKYLLDFTTWLGALLGHTEIILGSSILPLGISFFTFTQIGFLIDSYSKLTKSQGFIEYVLFVTFFPHVIAGPILQHREIAPQFRCETTYRFNPVNFSIGISIFVIGLTKKVIFADNLFMPNVAEVFSAPTEVPLLKVWCGVLSYFLQLYFDFSGYSEMALGLARMFNITFPANFDSPYKATNVVDFWQRWHISLTHFITRYVYTPISMSLSRYVVKRYGMLTPAKMRDLRIFSTLTAFPTILTMTLAGIWHGSGMQYLVYGGIHGFYLTANHAWKIWGGKKGLYVSDKLYINKSFKILLTCFFVMLAEIFFRSNSLQIALQVIKQMFAFGSIGVTFFPQGGTREVIKELLLVLCGLMFIWVFPNVLQIFEKFDPSLTKTRSASSLISVKWSPGILSGVVIAILLLVSILCMGGATEFIYFQF